MQVKIVGIFIRKFEIYSCGKSLTLCQKNVDVSCVVWDAAIVVPKYLEARCNDMGRLTSRLISFRTCCRNGMCGPNSSMLWVRNLDEYSLVSFVTLFLH